MVRRMACLVKTVREPVRKCKEPEQRDNLIPAIGFWITSLATCYVYFFKYLPLDIKYTHLKLSIARGSQKLSSDNQFGIAHTSPLSEADHQTEV